MARLIANLERYHQPVSLAEIQSLFDQTSNKIKILSGGTSLAFNRPDVSDVIDISGLPFKGCRRNVTGDLEIGALTTVGDLEEMPEVKQYANGILRQTTDKLASTPLRNLITIGGNILCGYYWADLPVALISLDAQIRLDNDPSKTFYMDDESRRGKPIKIADQSILTHIILPQKRSEYRSAFNKFARTTVDFSIVSVAISFVLDGQVIQDSRVVCGGIVPFPQRITAAEAVLDGERPDAKLFEKAGTIAAESIQIRPDSRAGAQYRKTVLAEMVKTVSFSALKESRNEA
ncbi:FAD binding domain-containing protein [bacterium]|nr:FAD binding domain-containing protein [candidate division CSSED10-310 bacterium]